MSCAKKKYLLEQIIETDFNNTPVFNCVNFSQYKEEYIFNQIPARKYI